MMTLEKQTNNIPTVKVIYILLIVSTLVGFTGIIALIMAYVMKGDSTNWLQTHYRFQIRTYWIAVLYVFLGILTLQIMLGYFILVFTFVWIVVRCTKGLKQLEDNQPVKNLESWFFT